MDARGDRARLATALGRINRVTPLHENDYVRKCSRGEPNQRTISTTLDRALGNLPELLASFVVHQRPHAIIVEDERMRYVQVLPQENGGIFVECVSNQYLQPSDHHDAQAHHVLERIGFSPPDESKGGPNWSWESDTEPSVLRASRMAGSALTAVLGLSRSARVTVLDRHVGFAPVQTVSDDADGTRAD